MMSPFSYGSLRLKRWVKTAVFGLLSLIFLASLVSIDVQAHAGIDPQDLSVSVPKNIVLLYSYGDGIPAYQQATRAFLSTMSEGGVSTNNLFLEYLDLERKKDTEHYGNLITLFRHKYQEKKIDLVVTVHTMALKFILNEGKDLFPGTPVLSYLAPNTIETPGTEHRFLLLPMKMDYRGTLELALRLFPQTKQVVFINGVGEGEKRLELEARSIFEQWRNRLKFEYTHDLSVEEMLQRIAALPPGTVVFYANVFRDKTGRTFVPKNVAERVARAANAPVFGMYNTILENGIIGGSLFNFELEGARAGAMALEILKGNLSLTKPVTILTNRRTPMFDWQQLKRWGVNEVQLPKETVFVNRSISFWERYKRYVFGVVLLILTQSLLIATLIVQKHRRRSTEELLWQKTEELDQFFNVALELLGIANTDGYFLLLNPSWESIFGYSREELMAKRFFDFIHPDDRDATIEAVSTLASQHEIIHFENRYRCKDGTYRWLDWTSAPAGKKIYAAARDITERKQTEEMLKKQIKFETMLAETSTSFINLPAERIDSEIEDVQRRLREYLDLDRSTLWQVCEDESGMLLLTHIHQLPGSPPAPEQANASEIFPWTAKKSLAGETVIISKMTDLPPEADRDRKNFNAYGTKSVVAVPLSVGEGPVFGVLTFAVLSEERSWSETVVMGFKLIAQVFANALARKKTELALRESEVRLSLAINAAKAGLWILEVDTGKVWASSETRELFHFTPDEDLTYKSFFNVIHPDDHERVIQAVQQTIESGEDLRCDYRIELPDGSVRWKMVRGKRYIRSIGEPVRLMGVSFDISERKQMEEELERQCEHMEEMIVERTTELAGAKARAESADRLKSVFLATMSHELRTPLNAIIGFSGILQQGLAGPLNEEQKKQLGMVRSSSKHLLVLINDVLDISKIEAGQLAVVRESFDLKRVIEKVFQTVRPLAEKKSLTLELDIAPAEAEIVSDMRRVEQILLNLLYNAVKFTEKGSVLAECRLNEGEVLIRIADTGIGIKKNDINSLFEPFRQIETHNDRRYQGTGLGLSISLKLVELLGGNIWVESEWGRGSVFSFTLPTNRRLA